MSSLDPTATAHSTSVEAYLERKAELGAPSRDFRQKCLKCRKPQVTCYCSSLAPIASHPRIVLLMHPLEARHPVGTGRMAHRCLTNSSLIVGTDFNDDPRIQALIDDPKLYPMVLFPGPRSTDLSTLNPDDRVHLFPAGREPVLIVIDGTWHLARKMLHRSPNLQKIPRLCFTPQRLSRFLIRKQPKPQCFSTIEAIHEVLTLLAPSPVPRPHDVLMSVFEEMVAKQLSFLGTAPSRHYLNYQTRQEKNQRRNCGKAQSSA